MSVPKITAWTGYEMSVDETEFTPWASEGWLSYNGQSPEIAVCDFVSQLVKMMRPDVVIETGVGQGYMTRTIVTALEGEGRLVAFESDDDWRQMIRAQRFWTDRIAVAALSELHTPSTDAFALADLAVLDSEFEVRFCEIQLWAEHAKPGAVSVIHDTADRDGTIHQSTRELIQDLGMTGVFLNNPRGCFLAVQPKEK